MDAVAIRPTHVYKLSDLAADLRVSLRTLERAVASGQLVGRRVGRYTFVTGRNVLAWLEAAPEEAGEPTLEATPDA